MLAAIKAVRFSTLPLIFLTALGGADVVSAQAYPAKSVKGIVGFPAGGGSDALARLVCAALSEKFGQQFVVDNKAGANTIIATQFVRGQPADGYTLLFVSASFAINPSLQKLDYDIEKDFTPVSLMAIVPLLLITNNNLPVNSVKDLIAMAKAQPGKLNYASFGIGSAAHLAGEILLSMTGTDMIHVPYKGSAPAVADLLSGQVALMFDSMQSQMPHLRAKRLRVLGLAAARRSAAAPEVPTLAEAGLPGVEGGSWYGLLAPAGTPREIVERLHAEVRKALAAPDLRQRFESAGADPLGNTPEEFAAQIRADIEKWGSVVRAAGIRAE
jgi:tripartite-type tricarboxylate transporter receptor subunit TctC